MARGAAGRLTGQRLGDWRIGQLLGRGAMGEVYTAIRSDDRQVAAVKVLHPTHESDPSKALLFAREAEAVGRLDSPHVVRLFDTGTDPEPYLAMELLEGDELASLLRSGRLAPLEVLRLVEECGAALAAPAERGVVHRDVKPSNLFRARRTDGTRVWKVLDFGVSKLVGTDATATQNRLIGTPAYIAPEQIRNEAVDSRADVFSLSGVAYRALTGRRPFAGNDVAAILYSTSHEQAVRPGAWARVHPDVDAALAVGLAKRPDQRYDSCGQLAAALGEAIQGQLPDELRARAKALLRKRPWTERTPERVASSVDRSVPGL